MNWERRRERNYICWREKIERLSHRKTLHRQRKTTTADHRWVRKLPAFSLASDSPQWILWEWKRWVRRPCLNHDDLQRSSLSCQQAACVNMQPKVVGQVLISQDFEVRHGAENLSPVALYFLKEPYQNKPITGSKTVKAKFTAEVGQKKLSLIRNKVFCSLFCIRANDAEQWKK